MTREDRSHPIGVALAVLAAPGVWLERARGRRRLALIGLYGLTALIGGFLLWRQSSLRGLPDVGDPFDVAAFGAVEVPDAENAFVIYREASRRYKELAQVDAPRTMPTEWAKASPEVRRWVEANREAIELFRAGSDLPRALLVPPREIAFDLILIVPQDIRFLARAVMLEASRREGVGDMAGSWVMYRATLRASRHVAMYGVAIQGVMGNAILQDAARVVTAWACDPRVDARTLRKAMDDLRLCEEMTRPPSEMIKMEYLSLMAALDDPRRARIVDGFLRSDGAWYYHLAGGPEAILFAEHEPERSRRVARLIFANWLAQADKFSGRRAPTADVPIALYQSDPGAPPAARALPPEILNRWLESTLLLSRFLPDCMPLQQRLDAERPLLAHLRLILAEELYRREHGALPKTLGELVGPDLERLPEGYEPGDAPDDPGADAASAGSGTP